MWLSRSFFFFSPLFLEFEPLRRAERRWVKKDTSCPVSLLSRLCTRFLERSCLSSSRDRDVYVCLSLSRALSLTLLRSLPTEGCAVPDFFPSAGVRVQENAVKLQLERQKVQEWYADLLNEMKEAYTFKTLQDRVTAEKHQQERLNEVGGRRKRKEMQGEDENKKD